MLAGQPASVASELYGLGVLLYHLATGSFPVRGRTLAALRDAHAKGERVSHRAYRSTVPASLADAIDRLIDPDPARRLTSVQDLARELWEMGAHGSGLRPLLPGWKAVPDECCGVWTDDGRWFVFTAADGPRRNLWALADAAGGSTREPVRLTSGSESYMGGLAPDDAPILLRDVSPEAVYELTIGRR